MKKRRNQRRDESLDTSIHRPVLPAGLDRRDFLKMLAVTGGFIATDGLLAGQIAHGAEELELEDPAYRSLYAETEGLFFQSEKWVEKTKSRLRWPEAGERVPEFDTLIPTTQPTQLDAFRKWARDAEKLGIRYNIQSVSISRWLEAVLTHAHGDVENHRSVLRPERVDATEWLTSRGYGYDRRNFGEWVNKEYDRLVEAQTRESDPEKRLKIIQEAEDVLANDLHIQQFGWGPAIIEAYNSAEWENARKTKGFGIGSFNMYWSYLKARPKTSRKRLVVGTTSLVKTINIIGAGGRGRALGRMIYDRFAWLDEELNVVPWAFESWDKRDERTWDCKLRGGMTFHDGKPVTVDDVKFTMDFLMKNERGIFWTANRFLESAEIKDRGNRIVRFRFKQPYGQFETYFMLLNVILPRHDWEGRMEQQGVDNPRRIKVTNPIGSGPFKMGRYKRDTEMQLLAHKSHFHAPHVDEVRVVVIPSVDGILGRLASQEIDFTDDVYLTPSQADQLRDLDHLTIVKTDDLQWFQGVPRICWLPWRDYEFRRAWHHSIDREFLVNVVWEGAARVPEANTFLVQGSPWYNPDLPPIPEYDLAKARQILKDAGYSWDSAGRLVYPPPSDTRFRERVNRVCKPGYTWGGLKMLG